MLLAVIGNGSFNLGPSCFLHSYQKWSAKLQKFDVLKFVKLSLTFFERLSNMAIPVVEFSREGYKIRKVFG